MAPKKKGGKKGGRLKQPVIIEDTSPKGFALLLWNALSLAVTVGGLVLIIVACLPTWRSTASTVYRFQNTSGKDSSSSYGPTHFGLFTHRFNNGAVSRPLSQSASLICAVTDYEVASEMFSILGTNGCGTTCISHFQTRCAVYRKLADVGYIALGAFVAAGLCFLVGGIWNIIFGRSYGCMFTAWGLGAVGGWAAMGYWWWVTEDQLASLRAVSQYPRATLGCSSIVAAACLVIGSVALVLASIAWSVGDYFDFQRRKDEVDMHLLYDGAPMGAFGPVDPLKCGGGGMLMCQPGPQPPGRPQHQQSQQQFFRMMQQQPQMMSQGGYGGGGMPSMMMQQGAARGTPQQPQQPQQMPHGMPPYLGGAPGMRPPGNQGAFGRPPQSFGLPGGYGMPSPLGSYGVPPGYGRQ